MKTFVTHIYAISPISGEILTYIGVNVKAISPKLAREWLDNNGYGYCHVIDELISEIPCKPSTLEPDFSKEIDFSNNFENN